MNAVVVYRVKRKGAKWLGQNVAWRRPLPPVLSPRPLHALRLAWRTCGIRRDIVRGLWLAAFILVGFVGGGLLMVANVETVQSHGEAVLTGRPLVDVTPASDAVYLPGL